MHVLIVEDDPELANGLVRSLEHAGFAVDTRSEPIDADHEVREGTFDAVVLDLGLPGADGLDLLRAWRADGLSLPVLVLTARDAWHERVDGLRAGADDYLGKPFHIEELVARLRAIVHRGSGRAPGRLRIGARALDEETQALIDSDGRRAALTGTEFRMLRYFALHAGKVLSKQRLLEHVWTDSQDRDSNLVEVYVRRLRDKLGDAAIETRRGQGYVLKGPVS